MARSRSRERQIRRLAERRATERRQQRRRRIIAGVVAGFVAVAGIGLAAVAFLGREEQREANPQAGPTPTPAAGIAACAGKIPAAAAAPKPTLEEPPKMEIDPSKTYRAEMQTSCGKVGIELFADRTPKTVNNFVALARQGFYDGLTFHRIVRDFVIQGGDPKGDGTGGPGYEFEDEIVDELTFDTPGLLAMANSGPDTNGSQFFITTGPAEHLNGKHTIFGQVVEGQNAVTRLNELPVEGEKPAQTAYIESITITES